MLEVSAISVIVILIIKELVSAGERQSRAANLLYLPALPLLVLFGFAAYYMITRIPPLT
jgi:hypothetical protein